MFQFCCNFDSGNLRNVNQLLQKPDYLKGSYPAQTQFFEFECKNDNEGTRHESPSKSYFNFLMRQTQQQSILNDDFEQFVDQNEYLQNKVKQQLNLLFIWRNPPKISRLAANQHKMCFRKFDNVQYTSELELRNIPVIFHRELLRIPSPFQVPFEQSGLIEKVEMQDVENYVSFYITVDADQSQILQICYTFPFSVGQIYQDMQLKPFKRFYDILQQTTVYQLPLRCYEFFGVETANQDYIVLTARIHPGESLQSYVLSHIINNLVQNNYLNNTTVLVIPCLNPDGCYRGNYRVDCFGHNLNRTYGQQGEDYIINQSICQLIQNILHGHKIKMMLDLHNHASKQNLVCFGNDLVDEELHKNNVSRQYMQQYIQQRHKQKFQQYLIDNQDMQGCSIPSNNQHFKYQKSISAPLQTNEKINRMEGLHQKLLEINELQKLNLKFPYFLQKLDLFVAQECDFSYESMGREDFRGEPIEGSQRVQMLKQFGIANVYTLEFNYSINITPLRVFKIDYNFFRKCAQGVFNAIAEFMTNYDVQIDQMRSFCLVTSLQKDLWHKK